MKIKSLFTNLSLLLLLAGNAAAQEADNAGSEEKRKLFEHQIGLDATLFIQNFTFNGGSFLGSPYTLNYKFLYNFKKGFIQNAGLRAGFGYNRTEASTENIIQGNSSQNRQISWDYRLGLETQKAIGKRWVAYLGFDYVIEEQDNSFKNSFKSGNTLFTTESSSKLEASGFGPVVGMQFNFSKHVALGTEMSFYSMEGKTETISQSGSSIPQVSVGKTKNIRLITPAFVNFIVRF